MMVQRNQAQAEVRCCSSSQIRLASTIANLPPKTTEETIIASRTRNFLTDSSNNNNNYTNYRMSKAFRWQPIIHCCHCAAILLVICLILPPPSLIRGIGCSVGRDEFDWQVEGKGVELNDRTKTSRIGTGTSNQSIDGSIDPQTPADLRRHQPPLEPTPFTVHHDDDSAAATTTNQTEMDANKTKPKAYHNHHHNQPTWPHLRPMMLKQASPRFRRSPLRPVAPSMPASYLMPINELRISGSKSEPPSRPSVDWSKQRPSFGPDIVRNVSVELGKTAYLTCKVFELGDKTVSWLRPSKNEILTSGRFTYIGDSRFASINDKGSHDWILEIKDVGLNDSTSYECQVSTDPKMSVIINLQVRAAKAKIKQGEQFYAPLGSSIEFTCEIGHKAAPNHLPSPISQSSSNGSGGGLQQTYWYYNGNLLNYAKTAHNSLDKNFSIEWDSMTQTSRFRLFSIQLNDAGNYTCKPTSAEPATIRLHVKKFNKSTLKDRTHYGNGYHSANTKEAQRNRQYISLENGSGLEMVTDSGAGLLSTGVWTNMIISWLLTLLLLYC